MAGVTEAAGAKTPLSSDLAAWVETLDLEQTITFTRYVRLVLPLDGYVFWVKANMITPSAIMNQLLLNRVGFNQAQHIASAAPTFDARGSFHYATDFRQEETENYAANSVIFTALEEVQDLNAIAPGTLWIGELDGIRFAFSSRGKFYKQADLFHYRGFAVYPDMETQLVDSIRGFDRSLVVSNSLPAWLAIAAYAKPWIAGGRIALYPSFLVPDNITPPFGAVHIDPSGTTALAAAPTIDILSNHQQLCMDRVRITLWGQRNRDALDFVDVVYQYSVDTAVIGIMNLPVTRDEKRTQAELATIAMKKIIDFDVSYLQSRMNDVGRKLILESIPEFFVSDQAA